MANLNSIFLNHKRNIAYVLAALVGFLAVDLIIKVIFIKEVSSLLSEEFLLNFIFFVIIALFYYFIIDGLSSFIEKILERHKDKITWITLISFLVLGVLFHYKYNLFDPAILQWLENNFPFITNIK